jgi:hypothetical protein
MQNNRIQRKKKITIQKRKKGKKKRQNKFLEEKLASVMRERKRECENVYCQK